MKKLTPFMLKLNKSEISSQGYTNKVKLSEKIYVLSKKQVKWSQELQGKLKRKLFL